MSSIEAVVASVITLVLVMGLYFLRWVTARRWVPVRAKLHHLRWKSRAMSAGLGYSGVDHTVRQNQCLYSFTFSSRKYYGIKTSLVPIYSMRNPIHKKITSTIANSPDGTIVEVFVSKNDPSKSVINRDFDWQVVGFLGLLSSGLSLLGLLVYFFDPHEFDYREFVLFTVLGVIIVAIMQWGNSRNYQKEIKALNSIPWLSE